MKAMTRIKVTYLAMDEEKIPIASASTFEDLKAGLDIYYGVEKGAAKCEGWFPYDSKYPDEYEGYYKYSWRMVLRDVVDEGVDTVKVYCIDYYPHTVYSTDVKDVTDLAEKAWEGCDGCTEADKQLYMNGFLAGYYAKNP